MVAVLHQARYVGRDACSHKRRVGAEQALTLGFILVKPGAVTPHRLHEVHVRKFIEVRLHGIAGAVWSANDLMLRIAPLRPASQRKNRAIRSGFRGVA